MITLQLYRKDDPLRPLGSRRLDDGELTIGRDPAADWAIPDPDRALSRFHCVVALQDGQLTVRDTSSNGVFVEDRRAPAEPTPIQCGQAMRLGDYLIVASPETDGAASAETGRAHASAPAGRAAEAGSSLDAPFHRPMLEPGALTEDAVSVPSDWTLPPTLPPALASSPLAADVETATPGSLLEAFCAGARLDASAFAGDDPEQVMHRLGAVYQQMVLGLVDLMGERSTVKGEYRLTRTTVRAEGNNPFNWAPAERVAIDLLRSRDDGFLSGSAAVRASFQDLKKHLLCMLAGFRGALAATLEGLSPQAVEEPLKGRSFGLKSRAGVAWENYIERHADLARRASDDAHSPMNREFRAAYERQLQDLDGIAPPG